MRKIAFLAISVMYGVRVSRSKGSRQSTWNEKTKLNQSRNEMVQADNNKPPEDQ